MKCDELEEEYLWTNNVKTPSTIMVRAYNADDVDKAIAELKARIQLDDDEMAGFLQLEEECGGGDLRKYIAELKQKLEDVQASHYAEIVDAGMENRRLQRALWLARASEASKEIDYWICQDETSYTLVDFNVRHETITSFKSLYHRPHQWILIWENVERKCRAKAEEYK